MSLIDRLDQAIRALRRKRKPSHMERVNALVAHLRAASSEGERDLVRAELAGLRRGGKPRAAKSLLKADNTVVARGKTADGYDLMLWSDGLLTGRQGERVRGGRLPASLMWLAWGEVGLAKWDELPAFVGAVRRAAGRRPAPRTPGELRALVWAGAPRRGGKRRFDPAQLKAGTAAELEHAKTIKKIVKRKLPVKQAAAEIAKDHLREDPAYYDRLDAVEVPKRKKGLKAPRLKLLHRSGSLRVYLVDSHAVRKLYGDWTMGGHHRVYPDFIPAREVWIAEEVFDPERKLCTLHELNEYKLMGGGQDYDTAHDASTALEQHYRKGKLRGLDAALKRALRAAARS